MNYKELENLERRLSASGDQHMNGFHQEMYREYVEKQARKADANVRPFEYFYEDIINETLDVDFKNRLGDYNYEHASDDARCCLGICDEFRKLNQWQVSGWLINALKFADHLVLNYIQEISGENPKKYPEFGEEKSRYKQLIEMNGPISLVGTYLKDLYQMRNQMEHRTITHEDGRQELIRPQRNKARRLVSKFFPVVLKRMI
jgi:hypothetical protein